MKSRLPKWAVLPSGHVNQIRKRQPFSATIYSFIHYSTRHLCFEFLKEEKLIYIIIIIIYIKNFYE